MHVHVRHITLINFTFHVQNHFILPFLGSMWEVVVAVADKWKITFNQYQKYDDADDSFEMKWSENN